MNKLIFLLCVAAFASCNKVERCYQCTMVYKAVDSNYTVPKTSTLEVCELSKDELNDYESQNTRKTNIYTKKTTCTR